MIGGQRRQTVWEIDSKTDSQPEAEKRIKKNWNRNSHREMGWIPSRHKYVKLYFLFQERRHIILSIFIYCSLCFVEMFVSPRLAITQQNADTMLWEKQNACCKAVQLLNRKWLTCGLAVRLGTSILSIDFGQNKSSNKDHN